MAFDLVAWFITLTTAIFLAIYIAESNDKISESIEDIDLDQYSHKQLTFGETKTLLEAGISLEHLKRILRYSTDLAAATAVWGALLVIPTLLADNQYTTIAIAGMLLLSGSFLLAGFFLHRSAKHSATALRKRLNLPTKPSERKKRRFPFRLGMKQKSSTLNDEPAPLSSEQPEKPPSD